MLPWLAIGLAGIGLTVELPLALILIARLPDAKTQIAAFGGLAYVCAMMAVAPASMLVMLGTVRPIEGHRFHRMFAFAGAISGVLALGFAVIVFSPLFDLLATRLLNLPPETIEPARLAGQILVPLVVMDSIRFLFQGVAVQCGHELWLDIGTGLRVAGVILALLVGWYLVESGMVHATGSAVAACAILFGATVHFTHAIIRKMQVQRSVRASGQSNVIATPEPWRSLISFYMPLSMVSLIEILWDVAILIFIMRMQNPINNLAAWSIAQCIAWLPVCAALGFSSIVGRTHNQYENRRQMIIFALRIGLLLSLLLVIIALPPLDGKILKDLMNLDLGCYQLAQSALWLMAPWPLIAIFTAFLQGCMIRLNRQSALTEAMIVGVLTLLTTLGIGVYNGNFQSSQIAAFATTFSALAEMLWLAGRFRFTKAQQD